MDKDTILCIIAANLPSFAECDFIEGGKIKITDTTTGRTFIVNAHEI